MHYRGFVFVDEPTEEAVSEAMQEFGGREESGDKWDWFRCGGRHDGYLQGDEEMTRRETHNGFNFDAANKSAARNSCKVSEIPADRQKIYFFVAGHAWVEREVYISGYPRGRFVDNDLFGAQLSQAIADNPDKWAVVVDAHD